MALPAGERRDVQGMSLSVLAFAGCVAAMTFALGVIYRRVWLDSFGPQITPTGFGVFLPAALLAAAVAFRQPASIVAAFAILGVAAAIYWFDDLMELRAVLRLALSFATGVSICAVLLASREGPPLWLLVCACAAFGGLNVVLTNIVNFYDGADLNLATFIILTAGIALLFMPAPDVITSSAIACLAFIVPFSFMNSQPRTIYLGDAGSFAFASFLTMVAVLYFTRGDLPPQIAIPIALPALDTFYVLCVRIIEKHDLMTRNYLHLYQKLNQAYKGFGYLLPQVVNAGLALACAVALQRCGLSTLVAVLTAMALVTVPFYFACRKMLLRPGGAKGDKVDAGPCGR